MRILSTSVVLLAFGLLVSAGHDHGHEATSYAVVTKHEDQGHGDNGHDGGHHMEHHHGHYELHGKAGHDDDQHGQHGGHDDGGHVQYEFKYGVKDTKTGDIKEQWESREGHSVKGGYTLKEADGTTRLVEYTSDKKKGFEATVHKIGQAHHDDGHQVHAGHHHGHY